MIDNSIIKKLKIAEIISETKDAKTFALEPQEGWNPEYKPGQFLTLVFYTKHGEKRRSYSISSLASLKEPLMITVKKVDNGEFSRLLVQHAKVGDILNSSGIGGFFVLPEIIEPTKHFCFIAAGSGITPCFALIKTLLVTTKNKITLIYSNRDTDSVIFYKALLALQQEHKYRFSIRFLFSSSNDTYNRRLSKWLLDQMVEEYIGTDVPNAVFYLCGPYEYMQTAEITLLVYTGKKNIVKENFSSLPRMVIPKPPDTDSHFVSIKINGHLHKILVQYPKSVLATAKANGIELPYSCEAGRCGSCIATCTNGKFWMAYNEVLTDKEVEKGRVLVCQAYPVGGDAEMEF
jgi:ferredoxin-NADP reductase